MRPGGNNFPNYLYIKPEKMGLRKIPGVGMGFMCIAINSLSIGWCFFVKMGNIYIAAKFYNPGHYSDNVPRRGHLSDEQVTVTTSIFSRDIR